MGEKGHESLLYIAENDIGKRKTGNSSVLLTNSNHSDPDLEEEESLREEIVEVKEGDNLEESLLERNIRMSASQFEGSGLKRIYLEGDRTPLKEVSRASKTEVNSPSG
jgi:hypothetical protein